MRRAAFLYTPSEPAGPSGGRTDSVVSQSSERPDQDVKPRQTFEIMRVEDEEIISAERDASTEHAQREPEACLRPGDSRTDREQTREPLNQGSTTMTPVRDQPFEAIEGTNRQDIAPSAGRLSADSCSIASGQDGDKTTRPGQQHTNSMATMAPTMMERNIMDYLDRHPTVMARVEEHRLQHMYTVGSKLVDAREEAIELPDFGGKRSFPPPLPAREKYVVEFSGFDDPRHAQNFPLKTKVTISAILIAFSLATNVASSDLSPATQTLENKFHVGQEVVILSTSLYVLGYAVGPSVFAPMSELYGKPANRWLQGATTTK